MKSKQILLILLILVALVAAWMVVLGSDKTAEEAALQSELVEKADAFVEKELYVRALPLYSEALSYSTDQNDAIYDKVLDCYTRSGDDESYLSLAESRVAQKKAGIDTCLRAAELLVGNNDLEEAESLLIDAFDYLEGDDAERIREFYETFRYATSMRITDIDEIIITRDMSVLPARNGDRYFFVNADGNEIFKTTYDSVTRFNSAGLSVVNNGKFFAINSDGAKYSVDETGVEDVSALSDRYVIAKKDGKYGFYTIDFEPVAEGLKFDEIVIGGADNWVVRSGDKWSLLDASGEDLTGAIFEDVALNSNGTLFTEMTVTKDGKSVISPAAFVKESGKWYLVDQSGAHIIEKGFSDAKAPEGDGYLAVANENSKWGFVNPDGELVIDYQFDDAKSFSCGLAAVNTNGKWGYISRRGELVIDAKFGSASPFVKGIAIADLNGKAAILTLELYSE